ncbi:MAG TPA: sialidase family protein [Aromatoleum sp.]|uniref:sialidase family protein n=1 Tax=Aromatoleum sp. TaxID=2307007 RepID=UPI002B46CCBA|nr:sialidase family protein [Aromatoleum sp.]HJV24257.1 sialidase family protein [Aromatoleum sp.]
MVRIIRFGRHAVALLAIAWAAGAGAQMHIHGKSGGEVAKAELGTSAAFASDGTLYAVSKDGQHVLLHHSRDDGASWEPPVAVNAVPEAISADGENRPKLAFAPDGGVLVSWTHPLTKPYTGEIRLARADDGKHFAAPITVHSDRQEITHRFETLAVTGKGQVLVAWIDKRDLETAQAAKRAYRGGAIYAAISDDGGRTFRAEFKLADHSCECCRIGVANDVDGRPLVMWRHVFEPNERDHALVKLGPDGMPGKVQRATFDHWRIDACPHHGPSLAVSLTGVRHAVWFNEKGGEGRVFYGRLVDGQVEGQRPVGGERAAHADIAASGGRVAIVWKEFDGLRTNLRAEVSDDDGVSFRAVALASTEGTSDQPRVIRRGDDLFAFWRTDKEGMKGYWLK